MSPVVKSGAHARTRSINDIDQLATRVPLSARPLLTGLRLTSGMTDLKELEQKLADARQEVRNLTIMAMRPNQSAKKVATIRNLKRSARAEVKLRVKALEYAKGQRRLRWR